MRDHGWRYGLGILMMLGCTIASGAQTKKAISPAKKTSASSARDFSGVWMLDAPPVNALVYWAYEFSPEEPPMTPWGEEQFKANKSSFGAHPYPLDETNDPVLHGCLPPGVPRVYVHPFPFQFIQTPDEIVILFEVDSLRREIYMNGATHDPGLVPLWMGDSIGHWEGDTLVVDAVNFNTKTWLDRVGHPHSDALHVVERFKKIDHDHLVDDITIEDPKAYTRPWTAHMKFRLRPWKLTEQFCEDGDSFLGLEKKEVPASK